MAVFDVDSAICGVETLQGKLSQIAVRGDVERDQDVKILFQKYEN